MVYSHIRKADKGARLGYFPCPHLNADHLDPGRTLLEAPSVVWPERPKHIRNATFTKIV